MFVLSMTVAIALSQEPVLVQDVRTGLEVGDSYRGFASLSEGTWRLLDSPGGCEVAELTWTGEQPPRPPNRHAPWLHVQFVVVDPDSPPEHRKPAHRDATQYQVRLEHWRQIRWPDAYRHLPQPDEADEVLPFEGRLVLGQRYTAVVNGESRMSMGYRPGQEPELVVEERWYPVALEEPYWASERVVEWSNPEALPDVEPGAELDVVFEVTGQRRRYSVIKYCGAGASSYRPYTTYVVSINEWRNR